MWPQHIEIFVIQSCTDLLAQLNLPFMKVPACASYISATAFALAEIQPVLELQKKFSLK